MVQRDAAGSRQRQVAAHLNSARAGDGTCSGQGHGARGIQRAQRERIDVVDRHLAGIGNCQRADEIVGASQLHRAGIGHREHRRAGVAATSVCNARLDQAIDKVQLDTRSITIVRRCDADRDPVGMGRREPVRQGAGQRQPTERTAIDRGRDGGGAAVGAAADDGVATDVERLRCAHACTCGDAQRTAIAQGGAAQLHIARRVEGGTARAATQRAQQHVAAAAGGEADGAGRADLRIAGHADATGTSEQSDGAVVA